MRISLAYRVGRYALGWRCPHGSYRPRRSCYVPDLVYHSARTPRAHVGRYGACSWLVQSLGQFLGTFLAPIILGPANDQWMLFGIVACVAGLLGTVIIALCKFK